jgi:hypothetical protein
MFWFPQVLSILLAAVGMALSLAHALELPGKPRLPEDTYRAVQTICYPGFTIGGAVGELGAILASLVLLLMTPAGTSFWLALATLLGLLLMRGLYWLLTHPVNRVWLEGQQVTS